MLPGVIDISSKFQSPAPSVGRPRKRKTNLGESLGETLGETRCRKSRQKSRRDPLRDARRDSRIGLYT